MLDVDRAGARVSVGLRDRGTRVARRDPGTALVARTTERVVVYDTYAVPTAWHLGRMHPGLAIGLGLDRTLYEDLPTVLPRTGPVPAPGRTGAGAEPR